MTQGRIPPGTDTGPPLLKVCGNGDRKRTGNSESTVTVYFCTAKDFVGTDQSMMCGTKGILSILRGDKMLVLRGRRMME